jgi:hypothetical protein
MSGNIPDMWSGCRKFLVVSAGNIDILGVPPGRKEHVNMSLAKTWYSPEEAESKFGVPKSLILKWVEEGIVRCEQRETRVLAVNGDDLELKVEEYVKKR